MGAMLDWNFPVLLLTAVSLVSGCVGDRVVRVEGVIERARVESNLILGAHAIGGPYQFTEEPYLLEVARELDVMGSSIIKFAAGPNYTRRPYFMDVEPGIDSLKDLLGLHPVYREVLAMPFRDYFFWASPFGNIRWQDGLNDREKRLLYREMRELAEYLLKEYSGTGKVFHIGHWEGDWLLLPSRNPDEDPSPERIQGFIEFLNTRQAAIEDARNNRLYEGVTIYHYTEVNLVMKGLDGVRPTLTNSVLPKVDVDYVSYSSYDTIQGSNMRDQVIKALDHIESKLKPRPNWKGKRVYAGEFAIRASLADFDAKEHDRRNREVISAFLEWGCPYILYWQVYCNEARPELPGGYNGFWLIDPEGVRYPLYDTFKDYWHAAAEYCDDVRAKTGAPPSEDEMREFALKTLTPNRISGEIID